MKAPIVGELVPNGRGLLDASPVTFPGLTALGGPVSRRSDPLATAGQFLGTFFSDLGGVEPGRTVHDSVSAPTPSGGPRMHPHTTELPFHKSSYSGARTDNCVEIADTAGASAIQDTKNPNQGHLLFPSAEWSALLSTTRIG